jgi:hypothetical protein
MDRAGSSLRLPKAPILLFFTASSSKHLSLLRCPRQSAYHISTAGPFRWGYLPDGHQFSSSRTSCGVNNDLFRGPASSPRPSAIAVPNHLLILNQSTSHTV